MVAWEPQFWVFCGADGCGEGHGGGGRDDGRGGGRYGGDGMTTLVISPVTPTNPGRLATPLLLRPGTTNSNQDYLHHHRWAQAELLLSER